MKVLYHSYLQYQTQRFQKDRRNSNADSDYLRVSHQSRALREPATTPTYRDVIVQETPQSVHSGLQISPPFFRLSVEVVGVDFLRTRESKTQQNR